MSQALQRRLARLFPQGNETLWLDCRAGVPALATALPVAVIGLNFLAAAAGAMCLPARSLVLDMDGGADMEDAIRSGVDGILCSPRLPWPRLALLAQQCRRWNYPFIADCREAPPQAVSRFCALGAHAALVAAAQSIPNIFPYGTSHLISSDTAMCTPKPTGVPHEH